MRFFIICAALLIAQADMASQAWADKPIWSYDGSDNAEDNWGVLSPDYQACLTGQAQSPVIISYTTEETLPALQFSYNAQDAHARAENLALRIYSLGKNALTESNHTYKLDYVEFHSPSEHTIRSQFFPVEMQFHHKDERNNRLIVSVFAQLGSPNAALKTALSTLPKSLDNEAKTSLDFAGLLPKQQGYYAYTGSLTAPPCTEGVEWRILKHPITISHDQLSNLTRYIGRNARLTQPIYMRIIKESKE